MHAGRYNETPASSGYKIQRRNRTGEEEGEDATGKKERKKDRRGIVSSTWGETEAGKRQEEEEENTEKTKTASPAYHHPSSSSPQPTAPLAPATPPRSHCREARTLLTGETKYRGNKQYGEAEVRRKRSNVCHHSRVPRRQLLTIVLPLLQHPWRRRRSLRLCTDGKNSSKHCPPPQRRAIVCSHQCHLKPPSTTTSPPLEVEEEIKRETGDRSREKKEHRKNKTEKE